MPRASTSRSTEISRLILSTISFGSRGIRLCSFRLVLKNAVRMKLIESLPRYRRLALLTTIDGLLAAAQDR